jgi:MOSC domain-containing protein YiiM
MSAHHTPSEGPYVLAVSISSGGIPKRPQVSALALKDGLVGDGHNHAKHIRPDRALSLWDHELLQEFRTAGFPLAPGAAGENLTVAGLHVQQLLPGTLLHAGDAIIRLEQPRKPCYVLDAIDPRLKDAVVGRFGYMASVVREGVICPGMPIELASSIDNECRDDHFPARETSREPGTIAYQMLAGPTVG